MIHSIIHVYICTVLVSHNDVHTRVIANDIGVYTYTYITLVREVELFVSLLVLRRYRGPSILEAQQTV